MTGGTVALVPAKDNAKSIFQTVRSLLATGRVDQVVVIDDGSKDDTTDQAKAAGAEVVRLEVNCGKGAALAIGVRATPEAAHYLLVDGDTAASAHSAANLLDRVQGGHVDLSIGVLPSAQGRGGFGLIKNLASAVIRRACGFNTLAPLSGQRAVRGEVLRSLTIAPRFGVEVAMTIDAVRSGLRVEEQPVMMEHDHRGRSWRGFAHRGRQGLDVASVGLRRLISVRLRMVLGVALVIGGFAFAGSRDGSPAEPVGLRQPVTVQVVPNATWDDADNLEPSYAGSAAMGRRERPPPGDLEATTLAPDQAALSRGSVVVVGTGVPGDKVLRPVLVFNAVGSGTLTSSSTHRTGLVATGDIPAVLSSAGPLNMDRLRDQVRMVAFYDRVQPYFIAALGAILTLIGLFAIRAARQRRRLRGADVLAKAVAAVPLSVFLVRGLGEWPTSSVWLWSALVVAVVGIISVMAGRSGGTVRSGEAGLDRSAPVRRILLATVVLILADLAAGSPLQASGVLGSSPSLASRYYGIGNPAAAVLLTSLTVWGALHLRSSVSRSAALVEVAAMSLVVTAFVAAPDLGADTGGLLAFGFGAVLLVSALYFRRISWRACAVGAAVSTLTLVLLGIVDSARPASDQTHLGRLVDQVGTSGWGPLAEVVIRRSDANFFSYGFPWTLVIFLAYGAAIVALWRNRRWLAALPGRSYVRLGVAVSLTAAMVLFLLNDSGIVVLALSALTIGPLLLIESSSRFLVNSNSEVLQS